MKAVLDPANLEGGFIPDDLIHYPVINPIINELVGEELNRPFSFTAIVTDPNSISQKQKELKENWYNFLTQVFISPEMTDEEAQVAMEYQQQYMKYQYKDVREIRANTLLKHYYIEQAFPQIFNKGFKDLLITGEELYQVDVEGGEPTLRHLSPTHTIILKNGSSCKVEDADIVVM